MSDLLTSAALFVAGGLLFAVLVLLAERKRVLADNRWLMRGLTYEQERRCDVERQLAAARAQLLPAPRRLVTPASARDVVDLAGAGPVNGARMRYVRRRS